MANGFRIPTGQRIPEAFSVFFLLLILFYVCELSIATDQAEITGFGLLGGTGDDDNEANPGDVVTFQCNASGNPSPLVSIWRRDRSVGYFSRDEERHFIRMSAESYGSATFTKEANCTDNNNYMCRAENTYQGSPYVTLEYLTVGVICPPTSCDGTDQPETFEVTVGQAETIYLCIAINHLEMHSYYYTRDLEYLVEKETVNGWESHSGSEISYSSLNNKRAFKIEFFTVNAADLANFRAVIRPVGTSNDSYIYFQLTEHDWNSDSYSYSSTTYENSVQNSNSDSSYSFPSTAATFDIALGGLLILNIIITIGLCGYVCGKNSHMAKVRQQSAYDAHAV